MGSGRLGGREGWNRELPAQVSPITYLCNCPVLTTAFSDITSLHNVPDLAHKGSRLYLTTKSRPTTSCNLLAYFCARLIAYTSHYDRSSSRVWFFVCRLGFISSNLALFAKNVIVGPIMREGQYKFLLHHLRAVCVEIARICVRTSFIVLTIAPRSYLYPRRSSR